jgi:hypothetical protein
MGASTLPGKKYRMQLFATNHLFYLLYERRIESSFLHMFSLCILCADEECHGLETNFTRLCHCNSYEN